MRKRALVIRWLRMDAKRLNGRFRSTKPEVGSSNLSGRANLLFVTVRAARK